MVAIKKIQSPKNPDREHTLWHITRRASAPNRSFSILHFPTSSLHIHAKFLNDQRGKEKDRWCSSLYYWLNSLIIFQVSFSFNLLVTKLVTFARILVAKYFFHSPWQPKWFQLGALSKRKLVAKLPEATSPSFSFHVLIALFSFRWPSLTTDGLVKTSDLITPMTLISIEHWAVLSVKIWSRCLPFANTGWSW